MGYRNLWMPRAQLGEDPEEEAMAEDKKVE